MKFDRKVLVVDDEDHVRKYLSLVLRDALTTVTLSEAKNGEEGLAVFKRERPSLVLMDVNMPIRDGLSALAEIRKVDPEAIVIMMTSLANRQTVEEALDKGATYYFRKDTPRQEISSAIRQIVSENFDA